VPFAYACAVISNASTARDSGSSRSFLVFRSTSKFGFH